MEAHWPLVQNYATAIDQRSAAPSLLLRKLEALGPISPLHGALEQIGNLQLTIFGFGYASDPQLRDAIHLMRQKQENYNGFKNRLFWFNKGECI